MNSNLEPHKKVAEKYNLGTLIEKGRSELASTPCKTGTLETAPRKGWLEQAFQQDRWNPIGSKQRFGQQIWFLPKKGL